MEFLYVFPKIAKIGNFWPKNADASRTQGVRRVI